MNINYSILKKYPLCHRCFGRLYAKLLHTTNLERGKGLKIAKAIELEARLKLLEEELEKSEINEEIEGIEKNDDIKDTKNIENKDDDEQKNEEDQITTKTDEILKEITEIKEELKEVYKSGLTEIKVNLDVEPEKCPWCKNIFDEENLNEISEKAAELLKEYEYDAFLVGTTLPKKIKELEKELETPFIESIRQEFGREIGKHLVAKTGKRVDKVNPDIVVLINPYNKKINLQVNPIFIKGRYRKLVRGIPQTHWHCRSCRGKGCPKCDFTGKQYPTSVEEIVAEPFMKATKGSGESFHGAGREDIDVKMLGNGRPFVLEIKEPKIRKIDLEKLAEEVNKSGKVEILDVSYGVRKDVVFFKNEAHKKTYLALVECEDEVSNDELTQLTKKLENLTINQRTPKRVSHRRADLVRVRKVYKVWAHKIDNHNFELKIFCDGGLYIKELISGDDGRTSPSVSEILGKKCICKVLDVLDVHDKE